MKDSRRLRGWKRFAGSSLVTFAAILVRLQAKREGSDFVRRLSINYTVYKSRLLRGWNWFAGSSLVTFAAILVRLQAKREGGEYVLWFFKTIILCMILAGCAGGTFLPPALKSRLHRFWFFSKRNGRVVILIWRLSTN